MWGSACGDVYEGGGQSWRLATLTWSGHAWTRDENTCGRCADVDGQTVSCLATCRRSHIRAVLARGNGNVVGFVISARRVCVLWLRHSRAWHLAAPPPRLREVTRSGV